jgi:ribonuclease P/MRP protein subunit RPP40
LEWCRGFLKNRSQRVVLGEFESEWVDVVSGVPQGSVLGPLLFVAYINDINNKIRSMCKLFADDTKLLRAIKTETDQFELQQDINSLVEWANEWLINFNQQKCKIMTISKNEQHYKFTMDGVELLHTSMEKNLGVLISNDLEWSNHVNSAVNKANQKLGQIKHSFQYLDEKMLKLLFVSLVRPHLEYTALVWNPHWQYDKDKLEKVQQRATRVESLRGYSYEERLKNWIYYHWKIEEEEEI